MKKSCYTPNLVDPARIEIGKMLIAHEMVKLFPKFDYEDLKVQVDTKWRDLKKDVVVRDFWNLVDSLTMGFKLKNIVGIITSQHYSRTLKRDVQISNLRFTTDISGLQSNGKTASEIKRFLENNKEAFQRIVQTTRREFPEGDNRHLDPAIILKNNNNQFFVHDGNGRLLKKIVGNKSTISAYIGEWTNVEKSNHWVPTSYLMRLFEEVKRNQQCVDLLISVLRESDNAIYEFKQRVPATNDEERELKTEIIKNLTHL